MKMIPYPMTKIKPNPNWHPIGQSIYWLYHSQWKAKLNQQKGLMGVNSPAPAPASKSKPKRNYPIQALSEDGYFYWIMPDGTKKVSGMTEDSNGNKVAAGFEEGELDPDRGFSGNEYMATTHPDVIQEGIRNYIANQIRASL